MKIRSSGYEGLGWVAALKDGKKPRDYHEKLAGADEADTLENVLERTCEAAFETPTTDETSEEAIARSSKEIQDKLAHDGNSEIVDQVKKAMAENDIEPWTLQIKDPGALLGQRDNVTKEQWDNSTDASWVEKVANMAIDANKNQRDRSWETVSPQATASHSFDPETAKGGRVMSSTTANEETTGRSSMLPANAASIFDPFRLDNYAAQENAHDEGVKASRDRAEKEKTARQEGRNKQEIPEDFSPMKSGAVISSGGEDSSEFHHRVPRDQVSMFDNVDGQEGEGLQERLAKLFEDKIPDTRSEIRKANDERREQIQRNPSSEDRSWEKVSKPSSTQGIQERLTDLWMPEEPGK
jgi:hypothetical protein